MQLESINTKERIAYLDFLKVICLCGMIVSHVNSPKWVQAFRSFDVPLMIIISASLVRRSYEKYLLEPKGIIKYYFSRIKRLVIPTWIFLIIYHILHYATTRELLGVNYYIASFCLTRYGIGFVWVILIYVYSALLIPIFYKLKLSPQGMVIVGASYILYEIAYHLKLGINNKIVDTTFYYVIPYGLLTYLGCNYFLMKERVKKVLIIVSSIVFFFLLFYYRVSYGVFYTLESIKYPPRLYYISYGISCSFVLLFLCQKTELQVYKSHIIRYISEHSLWIYLWHILILTGYKSFKLPDIWYVEFLIVFVGAILTVYCVNRILDSIEKNKKFIFLKYLRG